MGLLIVVALMLVVAALNKDADQAAHRTRTVSHCCELMEDRSSLMRRVYDGIGEKDA